LASFESAEIGAYLALSATSVAAADAIEADLADVLIHAEDIPPLIGRLATMEPPETSMLRCGASPATQERPALAAQAVARCSDGAENVATWSPPSSEGSNSPCARRGHQGEVADGAESDARIAAARGSA
jgi:hypothetical protein